MKEDYILIGTDLKSRFSIRFMSLQHAVAETLKIHKIKGALKPMFSEFIMGSVMLGSRKDEQEATLFKLKFSDCPLTFNCEVSPQGQFRSAVFPPQHKGKYAGDHKGDLKITKIYKKHPPTESIVNIEKGAIQHTFESYIASNSKEDSLFFIHADIKQMKHFFSIWIEKLPQADDAEWHDFTKIFSSMTLFKKAFKDTTDPDVITQRLFPEGFKIMAVTKPIIHCSCSKERVIEGLKTLPKDDLVEIFMDGKGVETQCDYCHKVWTITDADMNNILKIKSSVH